MAPLYSHLAIIGFGLIGSSIARAAKQAGVVGYISCIDADADVCRYVLEHNLADNATSDMDTGIADADLVIICTPVGTFSAVAAQIAPHLKAGATVSDVGSVKKLAAETLAILPDYVHVIPGHPVAGTEHSGPSAGFAELFQGRWCILTPNSQDYQSEAVVRLQSFWQKIGSKVEMMEPEHHDLVLAITSHLPHLIAYTIVGTATDLEDDLQSQIIKFSASGFRDFTRIAASDPVMWRDIFLNNKQAVLKILQRFNQDLQQMEAAIRNDDGEALFDQFTRARVVRRDVIDAGQARDYAPPKDDPAKAS